MGRLGPRAAQSALQGGPPSPVSRAVRNAAVSERPVCETTRIKFPRLTNLAGGFPKHTLCKRKRKSERKEGKMKRKKEEKQVRTGRPHHLERKSRTGWLSRSTA